LSQKPRALLSKLKAACPMLKAAAAVVAALGLAVVEAEEATSGAAVPAKFAEAAEEAG
jgi:hypothetical protein